MLRWYPKFSIFFSDVLNEKYYHVILKNNLVSQRYDSEEIFTRSNESKYFSKRSQKRSLAKWLKCKNKRSRSSFSWNVSKDESRRGNRSGTQLFSTRKSSCHCTQEITTAEGGVRVYNWGSGNRSRRNWTMESRRCR